MSAADHVSPYQMKLFMQAKELMNIPAADNGFMPMSTDLDGITEHKLAESRGPLYDSIKEEGVLTPVSLVSPSWKNEILMNGHHRVVSAHHINPEMYIPVEYKDTPEWMPK